MRLPALRTDSLQSKKAFACLQGILQAGNFNSLWKKKNPAPRNEAAPDFSVEEERESMCSQQDFGYVFFSCGVWVSLWQAPLQLAQPQPQDAFPLFFAFFIFVRIRTITDARAREIKMVAVIVFSPLEACCRLAFIRWLSCWKRFCLVCFPDLPEPYAAADRAYRPAGAGQ